MNLFWSQIAAWQIDLGWLGPMGWQGAAYVVPLLLACLVCVYKGRHSPGWDALAMVMVANWFGTRLIDVGDHGGGVIGLWLISDAGSYQEAVTRIAVGLIILDTIIATLLLKFSWILTLSRLIAFFFACMLPFYFLAAMGKIEGGTALDWVLGISLLQLASIFWTASGRGKWVVDCCGGNRRYRRFLYLLEAKAPWILPLAVGSGERDSMVDHPHRDKIAGRP